MVKAIFCRIVPLAHRADCGFYNGRLLGLLCSQQVPCHLTSRSGVVFGGFYQVGTPKACPNVQGSPRACFLLGRIYYT